jgi:hypothetical protein
MRNVNIVRKLTRKSVIGPPPKVEAETTLYTIYGMANGTRHSVEDNRGFGEWCALMGSFEAKRTSDGQMFAAPQCFLPEPMNQMIANQLDNGEVESVQFAFDIVAMPSDSPVGYEYQAKPIIPPTLSDPLQDLRAKALLSAPQPADIQGANVGDVGLA